MLNWTDDSPGWTDAGKAVVARRHDVRPGRGVLVIYDQLFTGNEEIPIYNVKLEGGSEVSIDDFEAWSFA